MSAAQELVDKPIKVLRMLNKSAKWGPIPGDLVIPWGGIFIGGFVLFYMILHWSLDVVLTLILGLSVSYWVLVGKHPQEFWGKFHNTPRWGLGFPKLDPNAEKLKPKVKSWKATESGKKRTISPVENRFDLATLVSFRLRGMQVGAYLLQKGKRLRLTFVFECFGITSSLSHAEAVQIAEQLEKGIKSLPHGELLTFVMSSFSSDADRQLQLLPLQNNAPLDELKFLVKAERKKVQQLAQQGIRRPRTLRIYATYTRGGDSEDATSARFPQRVLEGIEKFWQDLTDPKRDGVRENLEKFLRDGFDEGLIGMSEMLGNMGLDFSPYCEESIYTVDCKRFSNGKRAKIPQLIIVDNESMRWQINSQLHITTCLFADNIPTPDRRWLHLPEKGYGGGMMMAEPPEGWANRLTQLLSGSAILNQPDVYDAEIYLQLARANQQIVTNSVQELTKQNNAASNDANQKNRIDVGANFRTKKSVEVEEAFLDGAVPVHAAWMAMAWRPNPKSLSYALKKIKGFFLSPAVLVREENYFEDVWVEASMLSMKTLLKNRRLKWITSQVVGIEPVTFDKTRDSYGVELLSVNGGVPLFADIYSEEHGKTRHSMILGETGCGKSVKSGAFLLPALALDWDVFIIDSTRDDGSGTFDGLCNFVGGIYFNTLTECSSLLQKPDLRSFSGDEYKTRFQLWQDNAESTLLTIVMGVNKDPILTDNCRDVIRLILGIFLQNPTIRQLYDQAERDGFGTAAWQQQPTLHHFVKFLTVENLAHISVTGDGRLSPATMEALETCRMRLTACLNSKLGNAIGKPSSFDSTKSKLKVFALAGLNSEYEAAVLSLIAYSNALICSLSSPASLWFMDEASFLTIFDGFSEVLGGIAQKGRKAGIRLLMSGQGIGSIARSKAGTQILDNISRYLVGHITTSSASDLEKYLGIPKSISSRNTVEAFLPKKGATYTNWLLSSRGRNFFCQYHPSLQLLALLLNNKREVAIRQQFFAHYPNKYEALNKFIQYFFEGDHSILPENNKLPLAG